MGLGQTMITSAFLVLLTIAAMNANRMIVDRDANYYEQEAYREAGKLANGLLSEIMTKKFDETVDTSATGYMATTAFTPAAFLGTETYPDSVRIWIWWFYFNSPEANKVPQPDVVANPNILNYASIDNRYYDDVDDYKNYERQAQSGVLAGFTLNVDVYYVAKSNLNVASVTQTYFKKIVVTVRNPTYLPDKDLNGDGVVNKVDADSDGFPDDEVKLIFSTIKSY